MAPAASRIAPSRSNEITAQTPRPVNARTANANAVQNESTEKAQILYMDSFRLAERVGDTLNAAVANRRQPDLYVAECADSNQASAKNWRQKRCVPNALQFLRLAATIPEVRALVRELLAMETDNDPMLEQKISELHQYIARKG